MVQKWLRAGMITVVMAVSAVFFCTCGNRNNLFYGDALGYYLYLPSVFTYHNLASPDKIPAGVVLPANITNYLRELHEQKDIDQYTYGVALMELPFFFAANLLEHARGLPANGYSENYYLAIKAASIVYALLGLVLTYRVLRELFPAGVSVLTLSLVFLGSNLFWFTLYQAGMAHVPLFFLYAWVCLLTIRLHRRPRPAIFALCGLLCGFITLVRPSDMVCLLIPLLYGAYDRATLAARTAFLKAHRGGILLFALFFLLPAIPQLLYWKLVSGRYLLYSYGNQGFDWRHPKIMEGLFYYSNGWLPYSMIMIFSVLGLFLYKRAPGWKFVAFTVLPVYIYIIYSWYCYRYINGLGSRPMIHMYPLLSLFFAAFVVWVCERGVVAKFTFAALCVFFISVNVCYSVQQISGVLWSEESNAVFNAQMLFRTHLNYDDLVVNDLGETQPDSARLTKVRTLVHERFDDSTSPHYVRSNAFGGKYVFHTLASEVCEIVNINSTADTFRDAKWIKCSGMFMYPGCAPYFRHLFVMDISGVVWKGCKIENKIRYRDVDTFSRSVMLNYQEPGRWGYVSFYTRAPRFKGDRRFKVFLWDRDLSDVYIADLCVELYR